MSHATFDELNLCPGFGKVKARRVKDAFDKPFYPGRKAGTAPTGSTQSKGKKKAPEQQDQIMSESAPSNTVDDLDSAEKAALDELAREYSPDWDIDLDLNGSDQEEPGEAAGRDQSQSPSPLPPSTKKKKPNPFASSEWD